MLISPVFCRHFSKNLTKYHLIKCVSKLSTQSVVTNFDLLKSDFTVDESYYKNETNQKTILQNLRLRGMEDEFKQLFNPDLSGDELSKNLIEVSDLLPNLIHPNWTESDNEFRLVDTVGVDKKRDFKVEKAETILYNLGLGYFSDIKTGKLGMTGGKRSYCFTGNLAKLAKAIERWTMQKLIKDFNFTPIITPTLLKPDIIRACGFEPFGSRTQVYSLEAASKVCLAGTAEMPLAALHIGENFATSDDLPKRYCALSRCYRAEAKSSGEMSGLYRVHYFNKVEMFGIAESEPGISDKLLEEFVSIQRTLFTELGIHYRIIDMPPGDLGLPAYRKFDMEAYMPGRDFWGEISSASNCTDYQSKRLNITYNKFYFDKNNEDIVDVKKNFVHSVNGTACAIPRMIIAIVEQNQLQDGRVEIPEQLRPYMGCEMLDKCR